MSNFLQSMTNWLPAKQVVWDPVKHATGLTDAQMAGIAALAAGGAYALPALGMGAGGAAVAPAAGTTTAATTGAAGGSTAGGLLSGATSALQGASMAKGLLGGQQQVAQAPQLPQAQGADMSALIQANNSQLAALQQKRAQRQGLLGGVYG